MMMNQFKDFNLKDYMEKKREMSEEEKQARKDNFLKKYGYLDPIICQITYEMLNSKKRISLNKSSANGFNQKSVQRFCSNPYKIFSMYMQGDIMSKVWLYKDGLGNVQGPFMSYDMDIWNGEGNYFSDDLKISLMNNIYLPLSLFINRDQLIMEIVNLYMMKKQNQIRFMNKMK